MWKRAVPGWLADASVRGGTATVEIPSPRGLPIIGTTLDLLAAGGAPRLHEYVDARHRQLGPIYRESIGPVASVFVADPNDMRRVFSLEGKYPKHLLPPPWVVYNKMYGCKRGLFFMDGEEWLRFRRIMNRLLLLPTSGCELIKPCDAVATELVDRWAKKYSGRELAALELELYRWANKTNSLVTHMIPECKSGEGLLGALLAEGLDHRDVVRTVADLFLAAGDTTANSTQWILYLLARNPNLQDELYSELQEVHCSDDIVQLPLLRGTIREALRLYPVAPFLTRYLPEDSLIGGYHVPAGDLILLSIYTSGRDVKNFPKPNEFWPHRWTRDTAGNYKGVSNPFAYLPFAMGARACIGRKIADTQMAVTTAKVIQNFKLELADKKPVDMVLRLVAVPAHPIRLRLKPR